jgi:hypothetical protein
MGILFPVIARCVGKDIEEIKPRYVRSTSSPQGKSNSCPPEFLSLLTGDFSFDSLGCKINIITGKIVWN